MPKSHKAERTEQTMAQYRAIRDAIFRLSDDLECPAPPCFCKEVTKDICILLNPIRYFCFEIFTFWCFIGPINDKSLSQKVIPGHKSPVAAILAVVPIVTHGEILPGRNLIGPIVTVDTSRFYVLGIILFQRFAVDVDSAADHLDFVAGHTNKPFYICDFGFIRKLEHNDIFALGFFVRNNLGEES